MQQLVASIFDNFLIITLGVVSSLLAALIWYYFVAIRKALHALDRNIDEAVRPVKGYHDLYDFSVDLVYALNSFNRDYSRASLFRALPCEISSAISAHLGAGRGETDVNLREAEHIINEIIIQGDDKIGGSYDKSLFGKTGIRELDEETYRRIDTQYFSTHSPPSTSQLALHDNFNEFGLILIGSTKDIRTASVSEWHFGFMLFFSRDFRKFVRGFRFNNHRHIEPLEEIFNEKFEEAAHRFEIKSIREENEKFHGEVRSFYEINEGLASAEDP